MHAKFFAPGTFFVPVPQTSAIKTPRAAKHLKERRTIPDLFSKTSHIRSGRQTSAGWPASANRKCGAVPSWLLANENRERSYWRFHRPTTSLVKDGRQISRDKCNVFEFDSFLLIRNEAIRRQRERSIRKLECKTTNTTKASLDCVNQILKST